MNLQIHFPTAIFPKRVVIPICLQQPNLSKRNQELLHRLKITPLHIHTKLQSICPLSVSLFVLQDFTLLHWTSMIPSLTIASSFELQASYPPLYILPQTYDLTPESSNPEKKTAALKGTSKIHPPTIYLPQKKRINFLAAAH